MRKHSKDVSKVASLLMSVAMVGGSVVPNIPVWATTDDDGDDGVTIEKSTDGNTSEGAVATLLDDDSEIAARDAFTKLIIYVDNEDDSTGVELDSSLRDAMKVLLGKLGVENAPDELQVDFSFAGYRTKVADDDKVSTLYDTLSYRYDEENPDADVSMDIILYDNETQYMRVPVHLYDDGTGRSCVKVNQSEMKTGASYDGLKAINYDANGGKLGKEGVVSYRDSNENLSHIDNTASKENAKFIGWFLTPDADEDEDEFDAVDVNTKVQEIVDAGGTLYAHYSVANYTVSYVSGLDGVADPESVSLPYDTEIGEDNLPELSADGKIFMGWYTSADGGDKVTATTKVSGNMTLYAHWSDDNTTYTVTFDGQGGSVDGGSTKTYKPGDKLGTLPNANKENAVFEGWYTQPDGKGDKLNGTENVVGDVTYYAHYTTAKYRVTFNVNEGTFENGASSTATVEYGKALESVPGCFRNGYTFKGWFTEKDGKGTQIQAGSQITSDVTAYAYWVKDTQSFTITFDANGGNVSESTRTITSGQTVGTLPVPTRDNYSFAGWFTKASGGQEVKATDTPSGNVTYYARWTKVNKPMTSLKITSGDKTINLSDDLNLEYTYGPDDCDDTAVFWESDNPKVIRVDGDKLVVVGAGTARLTLRSSNGLSDSVTITVKNSNLLVKTVTWDKPEQTITNAEGLDTGFKWGPANADNAKFVYSSSDSKILEIAEDGSSWKLGGKKGDVVLTVATADGSVSAKMTVHVVEKNNDDKQDPIETNHKIMFNTTGGKAVETVVVKDGEGLAKLPTTSRDGYTFKGWATADGTVVTKLENVKADTTLYAQWEEVKQPEDTRITVTFELQNGQKATTQKVEKGGKLASLPTPTREGYTFLGWFTTSARGGKEITKDTTFDANTTIYAHWVETATKDKYTLTLDGNEGQINGKSGLTVVGTKLQSGTGAVNSLAQYKATRTGYTFAGWIDEKGTLVYNADGSVVAGTSYWKDANTYTGRDLTLYAKWMKNANQFVITYDTRGGNDIHPVAYTDGAIVSSFATPTRAGYTFDGWYMDDAYKTPVKELTMTKDYTIYAKWTKNKVDEPKKTYTVKFDSQGGSDVADITAEEGTVVDLVTPTREGYTFDGWFTEHDGGQMITSLTVSGNMTFYAHWTEDVKPVVKSTVTFDYNDGLGTVRKISATAGTEIGQLPIAARNGYVFLGWFDTPEGSDDDKSYESYVVQDKDTTVYARWKADGTKPVEGDYTLTFDSQSGSYVAPISAKEGVLIKSLPTPTREGYVFDGWFTDPVAGDKVEEIELHANTTLYAHWTEDAKADTWTVTLDDGVTTPHSFAISTKDAFTGFTTPVRDGYKFEGWFTEKDGGEKVADSVAYAGKKEVTFYAHWSKTGSDDKPSEDKKVTYIKLSASKLTKKMGEDLGLTYTYGPKGATNAEFVWTSSNEKVMKVITKDDGSQTMKYVGAGVTTLTISTKDGTVSDSCELTVTNSDGSTDNNNTEKVSYKLNLTLPDGRTATATVKNTASLDSLVTKLGYTVPKWAVDGTGEEIANSTTMGDLVKKVGSKSFVMKGYDSDGNAIVKVTITNKGDNTFDVVASKDVDGNSNNGGSDNNGNNGSDNNGSTDNNGGSDNNGNNNGSDGNGSTDDNGNADNTADEISTYTLTVVSTTGSTQKVTIKNNKTLSELANALGYTNVTKWTVKQANVSEYEIDGTTTMKTLAELISKNGDLAIIAYTSDGTALGCAKVVADGTEGSYTVTLSKDTNVALRSKEEIDQENASTDGKGKDDESKNEVSKDGKSDSEAPAVHTSDVATLPLYGALGGVSSVLLGAAAFLKKKFRK